MPRRTRTGERRRHGPGRGGVAGDQDDRLANDDDQSGEQEDDAQ